MTGLCQCGCGAPTKPAKQSDTRRGLIKGQPARFVRGHYARTQPRKHRGYLVVQQPGHPHATASGAVMVHQVIASAALGKPLPKGAEVHHVDGNRQNNANANLVICQDRAYHFLLHVRARTVRAGGHPNTQKWCGSCRTVKDLSDFARDRSNKATGLHVYCRACCAVKHAAWWRAS